MAARDGAIPALADRFELAVAGSADAAEIAWLATQATAAAGLWLALGCGIGRVVVPAVAAGHVMHGVDASASALALCGERFAGVGAGAGAGEAAIAGLVRQPLPELNLPFRYGFVHVDGERFQRIVDPVAALATLRHVAAHLVTPGVLVLDLCVPPEAQHAPGAMLVEVRTADAGDGALLTARSETLVDRDGRRIDRRIRYEKRAGRAIVLREDARLACTWYDDAEILAMVREAGFAQAAIAPSPRVAVEGERRYAVVAHN